MVGVAGLGGMQVGEKRGETASWRIGSDVLTEMNWGTYVFMSRCGDEAIIGLAVTYI